MKTLPEIIKESKVSIFQFYRKGKLWYKTDRGFEFPIPIEDCGDGTFLKEDKTILFMRYIRKHLKNIEDGSAETMIILNREESLSFVEILKESSLSRKTRNGIN